MSATTSTEPFQIDYWKSESDGKYMARVILTYTKKGTPGLTMPFVADNMKAARREAEVFIEKEMAKQLRHEANKHARKAGRKRQVLK